MKLLRFSIPVCAALFAVSCTQGSSTAPTSSGANVTSQSVAPTPPADVLFGVPGIGTGTFPPGSHDQSAHANDTLVPHTFTINLGDTVTYRTFGGHRVAIYAPGTQPKDIDPNITTAPVAGCPQVPIISDPNNFVKYLAPQPCAGGTTLPTFTPVERGKYLVICAFQPHFTEFQMWGWLIVK